jgi:hypothetical protein
MAGVLVSCHTVNHVIIGPLEFAQGVDGKVLWSSLDGNDYDLQFDKRPGKFPCKEGALLHVTAGKVTTCTVVAKGSQDNYTMYSYKRTQTGLAGQRTAATRAPLSVYSAIIWGCRTCGTVAQQNNIAVNVVDLGALIALRSDGTTSVLYQQTCPSSGGPYDACLYQGQTVRWELDGSGTSLEVDFMAGNTPCADGTYILKGTLPLACTTGTGSASLQTYSYTFTIMDAGATTFNSTVTVMKAP